MTNKWWLCYTVGAFCCHDVAVLYCEAFCCHYGNVHWNALYCMFTSNHQPNDILLDHLHLIIKHSYKYKNVSSQGKDFQLLVESMLWRSFKGKNVQLSTSKVYLMKWLPSTTQNWFQNWIKLFQFIQFMGKHLHIFILVLFKLA